MAFEIRTDRAVEISLPTKIELTLVRKKCDPHGLIL
jgi:glutaconate CoA-transferase, subunit B